LLGSAFKTSQGRPSARKKRSIMSNEDPTKSTNLPSNPTDDRKSPPNSKLGSNSIRTFTIGSLESCEQFAQRFALAIETPMVVCLSGTLGAGKTQFAKYLAVALGATPEEVTSPTFVLVHRYSTEPITYHLDAYRVDDEDEFLELGVEEFFEEAAITIIEWGEKFEHLFPSDHLKIDIEIISDAQRRFTISSSGESSNRIIGRL
jgi:tRNA threonylcarbamoyladenosine biosynthesis protein TsaE